MEWLRGHALFRGLDMLYVVNVLVMAASTVVCFVPVMLVAAGTHLSTTWTGPLLAAPDDAYFHAILDDTHQAVVFSGLPRESLVACLAMAVAPTMDVAIDLFRYATESQHTNDILAATSKRGVVRMNLIERAVFSLGCLVCGVTTLCPTSSTHYAILNIVNLATVNASGFLTIGPVVLFLQRTGSLGGGQLATLTVVAVCVASLCASFQGLVQDPHSSQYNALTLAGVVVYVVITAVYVLQLVRLAVPTVRRINDSLGEEETPTVVVHAYTLLRRCVDHASKKFAVTYHAIALAVVFTTNIWYFTVYYVNPTGFTVKSYSAFYWVYLLALALVFLVEMRARHEEVEDGLHAIESRKAFIRFISHEVRTPLSTAVMGMELIMESRLLGERDDAAAGGGAVAASDHLDTYAEQTETLAMIGESISAAVEILDDLLQFDSFEDDRGGVAVVKQRIGVWSAIRKAADPLRLQADKAGVKLKWDAATMATAESLKEGSLRQVAVDADRRKLAYVVRALVLHAIQNTPKGETVTMAVRLAPRAQPATRGWRRGSSTTTTNMNVAADTGPTADPAGTSSSPAPSSMTTSSGFRNGSFSGNAGPGTSGKSGRASLLAGWSGRRVVATNEQPGADNATPPGSPSAQSSGKGAPKKNPRRSSLGSLLMRGSLMEGGSGGRDREDNKHVVMEITDGEAAPSDDTHATLMSQVRAKVADTFKFRPGELATGIRSGGGSGSGLFMALSKRIIEIHGGRVWVTPATAGVGTTYGFSLPLSLGGVAATKSSMDRESVDNDEGMDALGASGDEHDKHGLDADVTDADLAVPVRSTRPFASSPVADVEAEAGAAHGGDGDGDGGGGGKHDARQLSPFVSLRRVDDAEPSRRLSARSAQAPGPTGHHASMMPVTHTVGGHPVFTLPVDVGLPQLDSSPGGRRSSGQMTRRSVEINTSRSQLSQISSDSSGGGGGDSFLWPPADNNNVGGGDPLSSHAYANAVRLAPLDRPGLRAADGAGTARSVVDGAGTARTIDSMVGPVDGTVCTARDTARGRSGGSGGGGGGGTDDASQASSAMLTQRTATAHPARHVLIVEDAAVCRTMLRKLLKSVNCTSEEAEDGAIAVDMVRKRLADPASGPAYDMILCDNVMPNMVGVDAVRLIRQLGYVNKPIFGVTGNMVQSDVEAFLEAGCDEILAKPLRKEVLVEAMRKAVKRSRASQRIASSGDLAALNVSNKSLKERA